MTPGLDPHLSPLCAVHGDCCIDQQVLQLHGLNQVCVPHQAAVTGLQRQTQKHMQQFECDVYDGELQLQDARYSFVGWYVLHTRLRSQVCDQETGAENSKAHLIS